MAETYQTLLDIDGLRQVRAHPVENAFDLALVWDARQWALDRMRDNGHCATGFIVRTLPPVGQARGLRYLGDTVGVVVRCIPMRRDYDTADGIVNSRWWVVVPARGPMCEEPLHHLHRAVRHAAFLYAQEPLQRALRDKRNRAARQRRAARRLDDEAMAGLMPADARPVPPLTEAPRRT